MATDAEIAATDRPSQTLLIMGRLNDLGDLATNAYTEAKRTLGDLKDSVVDAPLNAVDVTIGTSLDIAWPSTISPIVAATVAEQVKTELARVLGGDLGIPSSIWTALWVQAAGDLARQQVGRLRQARNRGAASFWALPSESVLAASRAIADEGARTLQLDRLQKAIAEGQMKQADFWKAVEQGLALSRVNLEGQSAAVELDKAKNAAKLGVGRLDQDGQATAAKIEIAQMQWIEGQANSLAQRIAELAFGYAQAAVAASQVSLGGSVSLSESASNSSSTSASRNAQKVW
jgi:hypothetical protein